MANDKSSKIKGSKFKIELTKRHKRLESKKKKAIALLSLIKEREKEEEEELAMCKKSPDSDSSSDNDGAPPAKLRKVDGKKSVKNETDCGSEQTASVDNSKTSKQPDWLSFDEVKQLRIKLREKQRASMQKPKLYLTLEELMKQNTNSEEDVDGPNDELPPLFMQDVQHLLLLGIMGNQTSAKPRWCRLLRMNKVVSVVVIVINKLCVSDIEEFAECLPFLRENFSMFVELASPHQYESTVDEDIFRVPLSRTQLSNMFKKDFYRNLKWSKKMGKKSLENDLFDRRSLLLNSSQLVSEGYPLPIKTEFGKYFDFVFSKHFYTDPKSNSPLFAIDCEMCFTTARKNELTRISVVNEKLEVVYENLVKPYNRIIDYLTRYSGITKTMLDPVTVRIEDVQRDLQKLLPPDAIWCGQSLDSDLKALHIFHPYVIDTSVIYNLSGIRWKKTGLKRLTECFLGRKIQQRQDGHCSQEDSVATMELVLLKLKNGLTFGDCTLEDIKEPSKCSDDSEARTKIKDTEICTKKTVDDSEAGTKVKDTEICTKKTVDDSETGTKVKDTEICTKKTVDDSETGTKVKDTEICTKKTVDDSETGTKVKDTEICTKKTVDDSEAGTKVKVTEICTKKTVDDSEARTKVKDTEICTKKTVDDSEAGTKVKDTDIFIKRTVDGSESGGKDNEMEESVEKKRRTFLQEKHYTNFFQQVEKMKKTAVVIDREEVTSRSKFQTSESVSCVHVASDKDCYKHAKKHLTDKSFIWTQFYGFSQAQSETPENTDLKKERLQKINMYMRKIVKKMCENSLVCVVLTGRNEGTKLCNGGAFVKIT